MIVRKRNYYDVQKENRLRQEDGWNRMEVQFLSTAETTGSEYSVVGRTIFPPKGASHEMHVHTDAEETMIIISGTGKAISGEEEMEIGPGDVIFVPKGDRHYVVNTSETETMEMIWVYGGAPSLERSGYKPMEENGK